MRILETALYAPNLEETADFYETVLGLNRFIEVPERHVFFRASWGVLLLFNPVATALPSRDPKMPVPPHGASGPGHLCFAGSAEELKKWRQRLTSRGVEIEADFNWPQGGRSIYFRDPAGNSVEIAEPKIWGFE